MEFIENVPKKSLKTRYFCIIFASFFCLSSVATPTSVKAQSCLQEYKQEIITEIRQSKNITLGAAALATVTTGIGGLIVLAGDFILFGPKRRSIYKTMRLFEDANNGFGEILDQTLQNLEKETQLKINREILIFVLLTLNKDRSACTYGQVTDFSYGDMYQHLFDYLVSISPAMRI